MKGYHNSNLIGSKESSFSKTTLKIISILVFQGLFLSLSGLMNASQGQTQCPSGNSAVPCTQPIKDRIRPSFSEEERRDFTQRGFSNTFLQDSLNGVGDPLGSSSIGGVKESNSAISPLSPQDRGILPAFDPTDVIIPRPAGIRGR
jgi:hypothetical protein